MFDIDGSLSAGAPGPSELSDAVSEVSDDMGSGVVFASSSPLLFSAEEPELFLLMLLVLAIRIEVRF